MSASTSDQLTLKKLFIFWLPLASTWLMMGLEGPYLAAIIARLADAKFNLAAYGVAYAIGLIIESPIIMIMSASTALVKDAGSLRKLRRFTIFLNISITVIMGILLIPTIFSWITEDLINLPKAVADLTFQATLLMLPWPAAIGYRRFYQGLLIRYGFTRRVAYGTVVRLLAMSASAFIMYMIGDIPGALVGAASLSIGVIAEAVVVRLMTTSLVTKLKLEQPEKNGDTNQLSYRFIIKFYYPLALMATIGLASQPMITFFVGQSRMALESLAVLPVVHGLVFVFRAFGLSYQEVAITFLDDTKESYKKLSKFSWLLSAFVTVSLSLIAFTPMAQIWYGDISALSIDLSAFAILPTQILVLMPMLSVIISFQRGLLVARNKTLPITLATIFEVMGIIVSLSLFILYVDMVGAVAAALAMIIGRLLANLYLIKPIRKAL